jgi:hypothetical protein
MLTAVVPEPTLIHGPPPSVGLGATERREQYSGDPDIAVNSQYVIADPER